MQIVCVYRYSADTVPGAVQLPIGSLSVWYYNSASSEAKSVLDASCGKRCTVRWALTSQGGFLARLPSGGNREVASSVPAVPLWRQFESFPNLFPIQLCEQRPQNVRGEGHGRASPSPHFLPVEGAAFGPGPPRTLRFFSSLYCRPTTHCIEVHGVAPARRTASRETLLLHC